MNKEPAIGVIFLFPCNSHDIVFLVSWKLLAAASYIIRTYNLHCVLLFLFLNHHITWFSFIIIFKVPIVVVFYKYLFQKMISYDFWRSQSMVITSFVRTSKLKFWIVYLCNIKNSFTTSLIHPTSFITLIHSFAK